jgi:hypothetical protein
MVTFKIMYPILRLLLVFPAMVASFSIGEKASFQQTTFHRNFFDSLITTSTHLSRRCFSAFSSAPGKCLQGTQLGVQSVRNQFSDERFNDYAGGRKPKHTGPSQFVSQPMKLYLEDTDSYGVMYNGYYLRAYERALRELHACIMQASGGRPKGSSVLNHSDFYVGKCQEHEFYSSPVLGECRYYVIKGNLDKVEDNGHETWSLKMVEYDEYTKETSKVYNSALLTIGSQKRRRTKPQEHTYTTGFEPPQYLTISDISEDEDSAPMSMPRCPHYNPLPKIFPKKTSITRRNKLIKCIDFDPRGGIVVHNEEDLMP